MAMRVRIPSPPQKGRNKEMFKQCPRLDFLQCNTALGECVDGCEIEKKCEMEKEKLNEKIEKSGSIPIGGTYVFSGR